MNRPVVPGHVPDHDVRLAQLREFLRTGLWFIPGLCVAGAVLLGAVMPLIDEALGGDQPSWLVFGRGPESASTILSSIAGGTLAFTGVVFSITIVALQLASSQFSPRVLRAFLRDRASQWPLGVFLATFVYALMTLRNVRPDADPDELGVPGLSMTVSFGMVLLSLFAFVYFVHHIAQSIRAVSIIETVARETRHAIRANYPSGESGAPPAAACPAEAPTQVVPLDHGPGALLGIDEDDLVAAASRHGCVLRLLPRIGDYLPSGVPLFEVFGGDGKVTASELVKHVGIGPERTMFQDPAFGFRQLVDIAGRALSPAINDPTTAVQCVDRIHDLLRRLAVRPCPSGHHFDERGNLRLVVSVTSFAEFVAIGFDEIRLYGASSLQVARRQRAAIADLLTVAPPSWCPPLERQARLLEEALDTEFPHLEDRRFAAEADPQGIR